MSSVAPAAGPAASAPQAPRRGLLRVLGVTFGLAVTIGNTIGAGILRTPGQVAEQLPSTALYLAVWVGGALYALLGAVSLAELGTMLPRSGGLYVFARHALGRYAGFLVGWADWAATAGSAAAVAVVLGEYVAGLVPALAGRTVPVAMAAVVGFAALQWRGVKTAGAAQTLTSAAKALVLLALVAACFVLPVRSPAPVAAAAAIPAGGALLAAVIVALQGVIYTYDGWTGVIYFSGELEDPGRDVPRSMIGGVLAVAAIYLLLNLAFLHVVPVAALAGEPLAAAAAARGVIGPAADTIIRVILVIGLLSAVNALVLMASRVAYAMSADGLFPRAGATVNRGGTPTVALAASVGVALAFIATGTFDAIIAVLAFFFVAEYILAFISVFVLRRREPEAPRPFRAWGYPWTTGLAIAASTAFLAGAVASDTRNSLYALALLAASYPAYLLATRWIDPTPPST
ncbi:MAG TPA: APC family permease [Longimicrobium sp.]|nr:APC family permease [Longimicrobium sp.]